MTDPSKKIVFPGSRWWKVDLHTHTPASADWRGPKESDGFTPEKWLASFMSAGIDCVAVTDHNSGNWIDGLQAAYRMMKAAADAGTPPAGFRELTIFPGVELSVNGGFHILAIFGPERSKSDVDSLLGAVGYAGSKGDSDAVTEASGEVVLQKIATAKAVALAAHADSAKGLIQVKAGTRSSVLDATTVRQVVESDHLAALETIDPNPNFPEAVAKAAARFARVLGSDCHAESGPKGPGCAFTWLKMGRPTAEGLRLALLDGSGVSVKRCDESAGFDPSKLPKHRIVRVSISKAAVAGRGSPLELRFSPYLNGIVGGRGSGKSTVVHALRLALGRHGELERLPDEASARTEFTNFRTVSDGRDDGGALKPETTVEVEWTQEDRSQRIKWSLDAKGHPQSLVEERLHADPSSAWTRSPSQFVTAERFPVRLFSQDQIAELSGDGRRALLDIIDEAAGTADVKKRFEDARLQYFSLQGQIRALDNALRETSEVERKLADVHRQLAVLENGEHAEAIRRHKNASLQKREVARAFHRMGELSAVLSRAASELGLDDWPEGVFDASADADVLAWRKRLEEVVAAAASTVAASAERLASAAQSEDPSDRLAQWGERVAEAARNHEATLRRLSEQGVADLGTTSKLFGDRSALQARRDDLTRTAERRSELAAQSASALEAVLGCRSELSAKREEFLHAKVDGNRFVQIRLERFGSDPNEIERSLREFLGIQDGRFESDILEAENGLPKRGLALRLAAADVGAREAALRCVKSDLTSPTDDLSARFRTFLERQLQQAEFSDRVRSWFPDDDLRIKYRREAGGDWTPIERASKGQRAAALLAFLLSFGDEPIVLDQPEDDLDNELIYDLIVKQLQENKQRRQVVVVTHNPNVLVNGDAEMVHVMAFKSGQCLVGEKGALQDLPVRKAVCKVMEGGQEALTRRWKRLGRGGDL